MNAAVGLMDGLGLDGDRCICVIPRQVATNASFNLQFNLGHFFALGPLTSLNLNIAAIWVTNPWVSIQINYWGSIPPTGEVPHTCKIVYYF